MTVHPPGSPEGQLQAIRRLVVKEKGREAFKSAEAWIESHPNHPRLPEAYLARGDAQVARRSYYKALFDYEYVLRTYPDSDQFFAALQREYKIAQLFSNGMRRKLWGMRIIGAGGEAEELFIRIQERAPGSDIGEKASLALGDYYFRRAEMTNAAEAYDLFLINYPRSVKREQAILQLIRANLATFKGPRFDGSGLIEAAQRLKTYQREFPAGAEQLGADALLVRIDESMALKDYYTAHWYQSRGERVSAVFLYERVIRDYPQTAAAQSALDAHRTLRPMLEPMDPADSAEPVAPETAP